MKSFSLLTEITYGPIVSRRLGLSLGVNLLPLGEKLCSFNCPYCQLGRNPRKSSKVQFPQPEQVAREVGAVLRRFREEKRALDRVTFSGNGEPTLHPRFAQVVEGVRDVRDREFPRARLAVLTNGAHLDRADVVRGLNRCDEPIVKLDAGNEKMFQKINVPRKGLTLAKIVRGIKRIRRPIVQAMFVAGPADNSTAEEVEDWLKLVAKIRPRECQVYTLDRVPAESKVLPVSRVRLMEISMRVSDELGIPTLVVLPD